MVEVSSCDSKGLWKVLGETDSRFSNQARKSSVTFVEAGEKSQNFKFHGIVVSKRCILAQPKPVTGVSSSDTEMPWKVWGKTYSWYPVHPKKSSASFVEAGEKGQNFKFDGIVMPKRCIG